MDDDAVHRSFHAAVRIGKAAIGTAKQARRCHKFKDEAGCQELFSKSAGLLRECAKCLDEAARAATDISPDDATP